tara:strand:- start:471 stop:962 length:492 start_codon:yes stop_codon:yes gene_type:complete
MNRNILSITFICLVFLASCSSQNQNKQSEANIEIVDKFFATVLTEPEKTKDLIHEDFKFEFMGISSLSGVIYNKEEYFDVWLGEVIPQVLPTGIELTIVGKIADEEGVVFQVEGEAEGINGEYNNRYAMVFKIKDNKIISFEEYTSDLLVETRLYKKEVVDQK